MFKRFLKRLENNRGNIEGEAIDTEAEQAIDVESEEYAAKVYAEIDKERNGEVIPAEESKPIVEDLEAGKTLEPEDTEAEAKPEGEETGEEDPKPAKDGEEEPETIEPEEEDLDARITKLAEKNEITYAEAKDDIEKTDKMIEQFKNDPREMAKALRSKDREYDKLKNELSKKEEVKEPVFRKMSEVQFVKAAKDKMNEDPDKYADLYRNKYPAKSERMSDEEIIEEIADREWMGYQDFAVKQEKELITKARTVRDDFITGIAEADRKFIPDVKAILSQLQDVDILQKDWNPDYIMMLAKGRAYDDDLKEARAGGLNAGKEDTKILGMIKTGSGKQKPVQKAKSTSLNQNQKEQAESMYTSDDGYEPEKAWKMFKETFEDEIKKNPSFLR